MARILIVDDDFIILVMFREMLEGAGYEVVDAHNGKVALEITMDYPADLIIMDIFMPEKEGIETIKKLMAEFPETKIIAISGGGDRQFDPEPYLEMLAKLGAKHTFKKPIMRDELLEAVREVLK
jgi:CheY-like chemotaxis protein